MGATGSGKTTLAKSIAERLDLPYLGLDSIAHLPDWGEIATEPFREAVGDIAEQDGWVIDGNYPRVRDIVWARADTVVFTDPPRWKVMGRLVPRTVRRVVTRQKLWNGNVEGWRNLVSRKENLLVWSWTTHPEMRDLYDQAMQNPDFRHLSFHRLRSSRAVSRFLTDLPTQ